MKHIKHLSRLILALFIIAQALPASAETIIPNDGSKAWSWKQTETDKYISNNSDFKTYFYHNGNRKDGNLDNIVCNGSNAYQTFDITDDGEYIRFHVPQGSGTIQVNYFWGKSLNPKDIDTRYPGQSDVNINSEGTITFVNDASIGWYLPNLDGAEYESLYFRQGNATGDGTQIKIVYEDNTEFHSGYKTSNARTFAVEDKKITHIFIEGKAGQSTSLKYISLLKKGNYREDIKLLVNRNSNDFNAATEVGGCSFTTYGATVVMEKSYCVEQETYFYVRNAEIGYMSVSNNVSYAPNLTPITTDFFMYYNGGNGIYSYNTYSNSNRIYRFSADDTPIAASNGYTQDNTTEPRIEINGEVYGGNNDYCCYELKPYTSTDRKAIGFKLDPTKKYRIKIYGHNANGNADFLYVGNVLSSATLVQRSQTSWLSGKNRIATYDIDPSITDASASPTGAKYNEIYWVANAYLGGFEILPYGDVNAAGSAMEAPSTWYFDSYAQSEVNQLSSTNEPAADVVRNGVHDNVAVNGPTMAFQAFRIDGHQVVQFRQGSEIKVKIPAKSRIKIKYNAWGPTMGITVASGSGTPTSYTRGGTQGDGNDNITVYYPASDYTTAEETITIGGIAGQDYLSIAGFEIEVKPEPRIEFDTNVPGIFTGKHRNKLLVYCTDNGTQENFVLPRAIFVDPDLDSPRSFDITTSSTVTYGNNAEYSAGGSANEGCQIKVETFGDVTVPYLGSVNPEHKYAFEDTDNDKLYLVTYSYHDNTKNVDVTNSYYVWFANYLKVGWWVNRDAKLIVDSNDSSKDPENIIVGDFYISSASTGHLYYEMFELPVYTTSNPFDANDPDIRCTWKTTKDNNTLSGTSEIVYDPTALDDGATTTWTYTNDDKNHTGSAINVNYPASTSAWADGKVVKDVYFKAERKGWPAWTAHIRFHFIEAPTVSCTVSDNVGTTTMTKASNCNADIYYTTDGTAPMVSVDGSGNCTPQYATYKYESPITSHYSTYFYATQMVKVDHKFYIHNPYTTNVFGKTFDNLKDEYGDNVSEYFPAMSRPQETFTNNSQTTTYSNGVLVLNDPLVEYFDSGFKLKRTDAAGKTTTSNLKVNDNGGFVYSYPFGSSATYTDGRLMNVLFGEKDTKVYRSVDGNNVFNEVGMKWNKDGTFDEHLDAHQYRFKTQGANYNGQNGNPHTECNAGIGGAKTEDGGMFLQPVAGDFMRFEPEYDGVITVWVRQNGAGQSDEVQGNITRRPVYFMDENGKVMKRSTVKPTSEHFYCINGTYGEINANNAAMRQDCRIDWLNGLKHWKRNYNDDPTKTLDKRFKSTFGLFNYWYGFPMYQNKNADGHVKGGNESDYFKYSMDVADSWISRTAMVQSVVCPWNSLLYRSEYLAGLESTSIKYFDEKGTQQKVGDGEGLSKYGYEMPSYSVVRYRFPVKAGKSYYMGGRGTKNGFVAYKFDKLDANYNPATYNWADNRAINESNYNCVALSSSDIHSGTVPSYANGTYENSSEYSQHGSLEHVQIFSRAGQENSDNTYPNGIDGKDAESGQTATGWKGFTDAQLFIDTNSAARGAQQGLTVNATLWRGFEAGKWYSIVLPFSISESRLKELFGPQVQVLYLDPYDNIITGGQRGDFQSAGRPAIEGSKLSFTYHKYQMLYANTPAFICPSRNCGQGFETSSSAMEIPRVTIDKTNLQPGKGYQTGIGYKIGEANYNGTDYEYWITGTYDYKAAGSGEMYFISNEKRNGVNQVTMYRSAEGVEVQPTRCWIEVRKKSDGTRVKIGAPRLTEIGFGCYDPDEYYDDPAGIDDVIMDDYTVERYNDGGVYDMLGRRVGEGSLDGLPKGVYIFNGQKVYVR